MEVEVRTHRARRRRPPAPTPEALRKTRLRNGFIYAGLTLLVAVLMLHGYLGHRPPDPPLPDLAETTGVRSAISTLGDSLQVVVSWDLTLSPPEGLPDSVRVKIVTDLRSDSVLSLRPASEFADTSFLAQPGPGQTLTGSSCVAARHPDAPLVESCTPWQYVRPSVAEAAALALQRVVIRPSGLQVDQDVDGRCARWQREHPGEPVWVAVNRVAVPACTGQNGVPTVAQFCAFFVLPDGRRVKAANSTNNPYCDELFEEWTRDRYS
jgi:hypothetical protein